MTIRETLDSGSWLRPLRWADPSMSGPGGALSLPIGTVSFLLTDIAGSTLLWQDDPDAMHAAVARHYEILDRAVSALGGVRPEEQGEGDSIVAAFSRASDAVRAALDAQLAFHAELWPTPRPIEVRMAVHTGEAKLRDEANYVGMTIIRTARLRAVASGGQVLVSSAARDLVLDQFGDEISLVDLGEHRLKDLARPERVFQLVHPDLPANFPALRSLDSVRNNLPVRLSSFIGRTEEVETLSGLLAGQRCVTVTGSGGAGKTRLALQTAAELSDRYPDGVWWIELAPITTEGRVAAAIADAIGVNHDDADEVTTALMRRLAPESALVVVDNAEHLVAEVASVVGQLLSSCSRVAVLTTSRVVLDVPGEVTWRIPPLTLPERDARVPIEQLAQFDAIRLFLDRARRVRPTFRLDDANGPAVAETCHRLSGIPLAIELAAARTKLLGPAQILDGLSDSLRILRGGSHLDAPRQQTLEASIAWSVTLLDVRERLLLERLSVFAGSFDLEAAEQICAGEGLAELEVLDALERLIDSSLVSPVETGDGRFQLLETIRQYAHRLLAERGATRDWKHRHAAWFHDLAARISPQCEMVNENWAVDTLDVERDNLRAALEWYAQTAQFDRLAEMAQVMNAFWDVNGDRVESIRWFTAALDALPAHDTVLRGRLYAHRAEARFSTGDYAGLVSDANEAIRIGELLGDRYASGRGRWTMATITSYSDDETSRRFTDEAVADLEAAGDAWARADALHWRANALTMRGMCNAARPYLDLAFAAAREIGSPLQLAKCRLTAADVDRVSGRPDEALRVARLLEAEGNFRARSRRASLSLTMALSAFDVGEPLPAGMDLLALADEALRNNDANAHQIYLLTWSYRQTLVEPSKVIEVLAGEIANPNPLFRDALEAGFAAAHLAAGNLEDARHHAARAVAASTDPMEIPIIQGWAKAMLAAALLRSDEPAEAEPLLRDALKSHVDNGLLTFLPMDVELLAEAHRQLGQPVDAARLLGHSSRLWNELTVARYATLVESQFDNLERHLRGELGDAAFETAFAEGERVSIDEIVAFVERSRGARRRPSIGWASLTPTELQVVELVGQGLTNKQIASRLLMGPETVKTHVSHVFAKLSVTSRSQLAAIAARHTAETST